MRRRICLWLLTGVLLLSCIPVSQAQAATQASPALYSQIRANVSKVVQSHAKKVQQNDSHNNALTDMAYHAMLKNGATLYLNDNSSTIASMFNALLFQEGLTEGITNTILTAQNLNQAVFFSNGNISWHVYGDGYQFNGWLSDKRDPSKYLGALVNSQNIYGGFYPGTQNANDKAMQLIAGGMGTDFVLKRTTVKANSVVYEIELHIHDNFDFNSTYSTQANKGYDVTMDRLLIKLGKMLNLMGADNFEWEYSTTLRVEVPYICDHTYDSYRWVYDASTQQMVSVPGDGFQDNPTVREDFTASDDTVRTYYQLSEAVVLSHNKPWVVEYDSADSKSMILSATASPITLPGLVQSSRSYTWIREYYYTKLDVDREGHTTRETMSHYTGVKISGQFKFVKDHTYTYRLENRIAANGSNMIWLSVYDKTTGQLVMEPTPMDEHLIQVNGEGERTLVDESSDRLNGMDFLINYIGDKWNSFKKTSLELRIWENGQDISAASAMTTAYKAPTCTQAGGYTSTCPHCGYVSTKQEAAKGHSFGTWSSNHDATCEKDGTVSATCTVCGITETKNDPGTAKGHNPQILPEKAPSCTETGLTQGSQCTTCHSILSPQNTLAATGHDWAAANCTTPKTCKVCAATEGDVVHHPISLEPVAPTCTETGLAEGMICRLCSAILKAQDVIAPLGHSWLDATCTAPRTCEVCALTQGEALGHDEKVLPGIAPTCTEPGLTEGKQCTRCSNTLLAQETVEAVGHAWLDATCTAPQTCESCFITQGDPAGHRHITLESLAPSCTEAGLTEGVGCRICGDILVSQEILDALGHNWLDATCAQPQTCETCGEHQGEALPHEAMPDGAFAPSCTEAGSTGTASCVNCGQVLAPEQSIPATGHKDEDQDGNCDLCAIRLKRPLTPAILAGIICAGVVIVTLPTAILIRKRKHP